MCSNPERNGAFNIRFFASGNILLSVADYCGVSASTTSRVVRKVSKAIARLSGKFIYMPTSKEEVMKTIAEFYAVAKFPKVIGGDRLHTH